MSVPWQGVKTLLRAETDSELFARFAKIDGMQPIGINSTVHRFGLLVVLSNEIARRGFHVPAWQELESAS